MKWPAYEEGGAGGGFFQIVPVPWTFLSSSMNFVHVYTERQWARALLHKKEQTNIYLFHSNQEHKHISQKGSSSNQSNQNEFEIWLLTSLSWDQHQWWLELESRAIALLYKKTSQSNIQTSLNSKLERRSMQSAKNQQLERSLRQVTCNQSICEFESVLAKNAENY